LAALASYQYALTPYVVKECPLLRLADVPEPKITFVSQHFERPHERHVSENEGLVRDRCHNPCSLFVAEKRDFRDRRRWRGHHLITAEALAAIEATLPAMAARLTVARIALRRYPRNLLTRWLRQRPLVDRPASIVRRWRTAPSGSSPGSRAAQSAWRRRARGHRTICSKSYAKANAGRRGCERTDPRLG